MKYPEVRQVIHEKETVTEIHLPDSTKTAALFDWDGTAMQNMDQHYEAWHALTARYGITITKEQFISQWHGKRSVDVIQNLFGNTLSNNYIDLLRRERLAIYKDIIKADPQEVAGFKTTLTAMGAAGLKLAVVTCGAKDTRDLQIPLLVENPDNIFHHIVGAEHVKKHKPHPEPYVYAAEKLGIAAKMCIAFEDSPDGVIAAATADIGTVIGISSEYTSADTLLEAGATITVPDYTNVRIVV